MPRPHEFQTPNRRSERLPLEGKSFLCPVCLCVDFYRSNIPGWRARHASPLRSITNCLPPLIRPLCGHLPPGEGIPQKDGTLLLRPTVHPLRATQAWPTSPYTPGGSASPEVRTKALSCLQRVAPKGPGVEGTRYDLSGCLEICYAPHPSALAGSHLPLHRGGKRSAGFCV